MKKNILLVGATQMAQDYIKVLQSQGINFKVVGRGKDNAIKCKENTGEDVFVGGLEKFFLENNNNFTHAIVAVGVDILFDISKLLLNNNIKNILVEKPGALFKSQLLELNLLSLENNCNIFIAYNRRFLSSTIKAIDIIKNDGGLKSFNFEFTEWSHEIKNLKKNKDVLNRWFLSNSTHVVDLAFFLGGKPQEISCYSSGEEVLDWHPSSSIFNGSGKTKNNVLFSYQANWIAPGRWSLEFMTNKHRLIFKPIEKLQIQKVGSINIEEFIIDNSLDVSFKPGLYKQVESFLSDNLENLCSLADQLEIFQTYKNIANY